ncbi:hypothetical protein KEM52_002519 [Ascosphaera acerosa]|nr:hypothetical protein KEM52_002519 [Ascosphaera acerosa]
MAVPDDDAARERALAVTVTVVVATSIALVVILASASMRAHGGYASLLAWLGRRDVEDETVERRRRQQRQQRRRQSPTAPLSSSTSSSSSTTTLSSPSSSLSSSAPTTTSTAGTTPATPATPASTTVTDYSTATRDSVTIFHGTAAYVVHFPYGSLADRTVTISDVRHAMARALDLGDARQCTVHVDAPGMPVPASGLDEDFMSAYSFGWCRGAVGRCAVKVETGLAAESGQAGAAAAARHRHPILANQHVHQQRQPQQLQVPPVTEWAGSVDIHSLSSHQPGAATAVITVQPAALAIKRARGKKAAKYARRKKLQEAATTSTTMGNAASASASASRRANDLSPHSTPAPTPPPHLTSHSLEPPKYSIGSTPHAQILALLAGYFSAVLRPQMERYIAAPPPDPKRVLR